MKVCSVFKRSTSAILGSEIISISAGDGTAGSGSSDYFDPSHENYTQPIYPFNFG
jgi:hypothetical protein